MLASSEGVTEVLGAVASLVATRFVDDEDAETSMQSPDFVLTGLIPGLLESPDQRFELALGGECGSHSEERLARADDGPPVCVSQAVAETIQRSAAELQEMRLMPLEPASLFRIKIRRTTLGSNLDALRTRTATCFGGTKRTLALRLPLAGRLISGGAARANRVD